MNEGIHLDLDTWIVPGQIRKANSVLYMLNKNIETGQCREAGTSLEDCREAGTSLEDGVGKPVPPYRTV